MTEKETKLFNKLQKEAYIYAEKEGYKRLSCNNQDITKVHIYELHRVVIIGTGKITHILIVIDLNAGSFYIFKTI